VASTGWVRNPQTTQQTKRRKERMARKNPVHKEYTMKDNGRTFYGKGAKAAKKLDARISVYNAMVAASKWGGVEYIKPGSMKL